MTLEKFSLKIFSTIFLFTFLIYSLEINLHAADDKSELKLLVTPNITGERIFFVRKHNTSGMRVGDIYSMNSNGGEVQQITNFSKDLFITELPSISRDGKKLAFISNYAEWKSSNYADAFIADLYTGNIKRVTGYEKISQNTETGTVNVTVVDPKGYALTPSAIRISFSGCNNFIAGNTATLTVPANEEVWIKAIVARGKGDIKVVKLTAGSSTSVQLDLSAGTITAESCSPSFNGDYLAVSRNSENMNFPWNKILIWNTKTRLPIAEVGGLKLGGDIYPAYSPDDSKLAFGTGESFINSLGIVSTGNITAQPELLAFGNILGFQAFCSQPAWSPDGNEVAFIYTILSGLEIQSNIYKVSINSGNSTQLTYYSGNEIVSKPSYSPDGSKITFTYLKSNNNVFALTDLINGTYLSNIYTISSNGGNTTALTNDGNSLDPYWGYVNPTVAIEETKIENEFNLSQNYPNPFNPTTTIDFSIPVSTKVTLKIFDVLGNEVTTLVHEYKTAGSYETEFNGSNLSSGIYFYRLETSEFIQLRKMVLLK